LSASFSPVEHNIRLHQIDSAATVFFCERKSTYPFWVEIVAGRSWYSS
jgi:hypothetical protein